MGKFQTKEQAKQWYEENGYTAVVDSAQEVELEYANMLPKLESLFSRHSMKMPDIVVGTKQEKDVWFKETVGDLQKTRMLINYVNQELDKINVGGAK